MKKFRLQKEEIVRLVPAEAGGCLITDMIVVDGKRIGYMYREITARKEDSGWRFFSGEESQEYLNDMEHTDVYSVNTAANYDRDIIPYLNTPAPCAFERVPGTSLFRRVE